MKAHFEHGTDPGTGRPMSTLKDAQGNPLLVFVARTKYGLILKQENLLALAGRESNFDTYGCEGYWGFDLGVRSATGFRAIARTIRLYYSAIARDNAITQVRRIAQFANLQPVMN